ncbi:hypothetical protein DF18_37410 [Streptomyces rimosus]|nr:hypothetical protein DF18_37410 [Streptomyces rimosus]
MPGDGVPGTAYGARVLVLDLAASVLQLPDRHQDAFEEVEGFEAGDDDGDVPVGGDRFVRGPAHHGAHMSGGEKGLYFAVGVGQQGGHGRGDEDVADQDGEVGQAQPAGMQDGHGVGGRGGLEADGQEDHLAPRFGHGGPYGVHRGVDDPYVRTARP